MSDARHDSPPRRWDTGRVETFSDAVFARSTDEASRTAVGLYGLTAIVIDVLVEASVRHVARHPELARSNPSETPAAPLPEAPSWRPSPSVLVYGLAILAGIFVFPKLAAAAYLAVAVRALVMLHSDTGVGFRLLRPR